MNILKKIRLTQAGVWAFVLWIGTAVSLSAASDPNVAASKVASPEQTQDQPLIEHLTKADFLARIFDYQQQDWRYLGKQPAIVDFYATWCVPCRRLAPVLEDLAKEYEGKLLIYKVDTDKERELSSDFGITSIPTLLFIPVDGDPQIVQGALPKEELKKIIDGFLLK